VSYEAVCSGVGLVTLYGFLRERSHTREPAWLARAIPGGDAAAAISSAGLTGADPVCAQALDLMDSIYGAEAGNLALRLLATGGIYVGGGSHRTSCPSCGGARSSTLSPRRAGFARCSSRSRCT
jgi:glucokinase